MGEVLTCGAVCTEDQVSSYSDTPDGDYFIINRDTTLTMRFKWNNASLPDIPCPDPQTVRLYYRKKFRGNAGWGTWFTLGALQPVDCNAGSTKPVKTTGSIGWSATAGVWYEREVLFCKTGMYEIIMDISCGILPDPRTGFMQARTARIQVL